MGKLPSKAKFNAQYKAAVERGRQARAAGLLAEKASYDAAHERILLTLTTGVLVGIPISGTSLGKYLAKATPVERKAVTLTPTGSGVSWRALDVDLSVEGLLFETFGRMPFAQALGRLGGQAKSSTKARSSRANGALGGRPRKHAA